MHAPATAPATAWWCDTSALLFYMALGTLLHMHACTYIVNSAQNFQHFPNAQVHIPWAVLCSSDNRVYRWNARVQVHLWSVHFLFLLLAFLSWNNTFWFFAFVWVVRFPADNSDLGFGEPSVFREGWFSYIYFFENLIELWAKNRILEADLFAFDRGIRIRTISTELAANDSSGPYVQGFFFCDTKRYFRRYAVFCILLPATSCTR